MEPVEHILQFFAFSHLPPHLQAVSKPFSDALEWFNASVMGAGWVEKFLALEACVMSLPSNPERDWSACKLNSARQCESNEARLRLLLEAKDCAVRALVAKP